MEGGHVALIPKNPYYYETYRDAVARVCCAPPRWVVVIMGHELYGVVKAALTLVSDEMLQSTRRWGNLLAPSTVDSKWIA